MLSNHKHWVWLKWQPRKSQWMVAHVHGAFTVCVHAPFGTFVVAWPGIRQCCLYNGRERGLCTCTHTHTHSHVFPWIPRVGMGLNRNLGHAGILNTLSQKKPFTADSNVTWSTLLAPMLHLRHAAITQKCRSTFVVSGAQSWPNANCCCPHAASCAPKHQTWSPFHFPSLLHPWSPSRSCVPISF